MLWQIFWSLFSSWRSSWFRQFVTALSLWNGPFCLYSSLASAGVVNFPSRHTDSHTHLTASKVAVGCLTEQRVSLVVPVSGSLSCHTDLRWQTCGLSSYLGSVVPCQMPRPYRHALHLLLLNINIRSRIWNCLQIVLLPGNEKSYISLEELSFLLGFMKMPWYQDSCCPAALWLIPAIVTLSGENNIEWSPMFMWPVDISLRSQRIDD